MQIKVHCKGNNCLRHNKQTASAKIFLWSVQTTFCRSSNQWVTEEPESDRSKKCFSVSSQDAFSCFFSNLICRASCWFYEVTICTRSCTCSCFLDDGWDETISICYDSKRRFIKQTENCFLFRGFLSLIKMFLSISDEEWLTSASLSRLLGYPIAALEYLQALPRNSTDLPQNIIIITCTALQNPSCSQTG